MIFLEMYLIIWINIFKRVCVFLCNNLIFSNLFKVVDKDFYIKVFIVLLFLIMEIKKLIFLIIELNKLGYFLRWLFIY